MLLAPIAPNHPRTQRSALQQWIAAQPGVPEIVDTLVSGGKTLRGSIAQNTYATEIKALRKRLDRVELTRRPDCRQTQPP